MRTSRTTLTRLPSRGYYDKETIYEILDNNYLCHIACIRDGSPVIIPTSYGRNGDHLFIHGSVRSQLLTELAQGTEACLSVIQLDGLVLARSLFHSSMNYHSVVLFGKGEEVSDIDQKNAALKVITESLWKGRWEEARTPTENELHATKVIRFPIKEGSAKIRTGPPSDNAEDYDLDVWAGVIPILRSFGNPVPDGRLKDGVPLPRSLSNI